MNSSIRNIATSAITNKYLRAQTMLKAKFTTYNENAKNLSGDKELVSSYSVVVPYKGKLIEAVDIRCWMGRSASASTVYATIWCRGKEEWASGHGSAGGYGYHKESAAVQNAIASAGIKLYGDVYGRKETKKEAFIDGVGDSAIISAALAITKALGYRSDKALIITK